MEKVKINSTPKVVADTELGLILGSIELTASQEQIFKALTDPREIERWWGSDDVYHMREWKADTRPGGTYTVKVHNANGNIAPASGEFLIVEKPNKLAHTRRYDWGFPVLGRAATTITYLIDKTDGGSKLTVRHEGFSSAPEACNQHAAGWERVLEWLDKYLRKDQ
jgi:uncharacterized protein YndB with AHSA1/START domain